MFSSNWRTSQKKLFGGTFFVHSFWAQNKILCAVKNCSLLLTTNRMTPVNWSMFEKSAAPYGSSYPPLLQATKPIVITHCFKTTFLSKLKQELYMVLTNYSIENHWTKLLSYETFDGWPSKNLEELKAYWIPIILQVKNAWVYWYLALLKLLKTFLFCVKIPLMITILIYDAQSLDFVLNWRYTEGGAHFVRLGSHFGLRPRMVVKPRSPSRGACNYPTFLSQRFSIYF